MKKINRIVALTASFAPAMVLAADITSIIQSVSGWLKMIVPIVVTLALIYFFWGLANYILKAGDEGAQAEARGMMIYGIIALFVMMAVWGLVGVLANSFGVGTGGSMNVPTVQ